MKYLLIIYQAIIARIAGGGIWPQRPPQVAEVAFAVPIGAACVLPDWWGGVIGMLWAWAWIQTGPGTANAMGSKPEVAQSGRKETLSFIVDPVCRIFRQPLGGDFYCWAFMGLKGALIHLPLGWYAVPAAVLWPGAYWIGNKLIRDRFAPKMQGNAIAELTAGACSGLLVALAWG